MRLALIPDKLGLVARRALPLRVAAEAAIHGFDILVHVADLLRGLLDLPASGLQMSLDALPLGARGNRAAAASLLLHLHILRQRHDALVRHPLGVLKPRAHRRLVRLCGDPQPRLLRQQNSAGHLPPELPPPLIPRHRHFGSSRPVGSCFRSNHLGGCSFASSYQFGSQHLVLLDRILDKLLVHLKASSKLGQDALRELIEVVQNVVLEQVEATFGYPRL
mmetsp:Transcript_168176/g.540269  ORF Transcript_168176/g.540269 Transcript_168176/m.540269 type:complete len:220 (-) Transcript_168176:1347-2006(-)